ncbi:MAG: type II toxin-antitoxin system RelE/ParE family toxin [Clostridiales bacterium]|nr:type II toxin-antitoxin system RelE/ParE family toxin [Clostridiales bacterium]
MYNYIEKNLKNPKAAKDLNQKIRKIFEQIKQFPESGLNSRSEKEYKNVLIDNYIAFYKIDKKHKIIILYRVVYGLMDYDKFI